jgi:hypothetical protein
MVFLCVGHSKKTLHVGSSVQHFVACVFSVVVVVVVLVVLVVSY